MTASSDFSSSFASRHVRYLSILDLVSVPHCDNSDRIWSTRVWLVATEEDLIAVEPSYENQHTRLFPLFPFSRVSQVQGDKGNLLLSNGLAANIPLFGNNSIVKKL